MGDTNPSLTSQAVETMSLTLTYYGVIYSKKNSKQIIMNRRTKRPMIVSNEKAKQMEEDMAKQFSDAYRTLSPIVSHPFATICGRPLKITIEIWQKDRIRRDLDNQATSVLDALVAGGVIADDSVDVIQELTIKMMGVDKNHPRATVTITAKGGADI